MPLYSIQNITETTQAEATTTPDDMTPQ